MRRVEVASGSAAVLIGAAAYALTLPFPEMPDGHPGPALFPRLLAGLLVIFGALLAVQGLRAAATTPLADAEVRSTADRRGLLDAALVVGAVAAYILLVERLGFVLTVLLLDLLLMLRLRVQPVLAIAVAAPLAVGVYLLFARLLLVPLPRGPLPF